MEARLPPSTSALYTGTFVPRMTFLSGFLIRSCQTFGKSREGHRGNVDQSQFPIDLALVLKFVKDGSLIPWSLSLSLLSI